MMAVGKSRLFLVTGTGEGGGHAKGDEHAAGNVPLGAKPEGVATQPVGYGAREQRPEAVAQDAGDAEGFLAAKFLHAEIDQVRRAKVLHEAEGRGRRNEQGGEAYGGGECVDQRAHANPKRRNQAGAAALADAAAKNVKDGRARDRQEDDGGAHEKQKRGMAEEHRRKDSGPELVAVAAATAATASATAAGRGGRGFRRSAVAGAVGGGEDRKLDGCFLAGTLGAGDFLLLVDDDFLEARFAIVTDVFVDRHRLIPARLKIPQKLFNSHLRLPKNALQDRQRQIKSIVPGNSDTQVRLLRVAQFRVAARLMMNIKPRLLQSAENFLRFQDGQTRRHSCTKRDTQLFLSCALFIRDAFAVLPKRF